LIVSFTEQKLFSLMQSTLSIFTFISYAFEILSYCPLFGKGQRQKLKTIYQRPRGKWVEEMEIGVYTACFNYCAMLLYMLEESDSIPG
jgi:hypothetical protein